MLSQCRAAVRLDSRVVAMNNNGANSSSSGGIGFVGLLAILFIALKLTGYINWSWWWVLAPIWGGGIIMVVLIGGFVLLLAIAEARTGRRNRRWR
jgi:hypothetical protein